jgi:hypothetical protein
VKNMLKLIFVPKSEEVTGGLKKLHNENLHVICTIHEML